MRINYRPQGVCSQLFEIDIDDSTHVINEFNVQGGCNGNLKGIKALIEGMKAEDVISKIEGIKCGFKSTSCPDQISKALKSYINAQ